MKLTFVMLVCLIAMVAGQGKTTKKAGTTKKAAAKTTKAAATTKKAPATKKGGATRKKKATKKKFKDVHLSKNLNDCVNKNGKWIEITLTDEAGTNGLQLDFVKVDEQKSLKTLKTPIQKAKIRRLSRRDDVVTFKDSFCLDYLGKDFSPCYDIVTSSQGKRLEELSWSVKVAALKRASEEEKKKGEKDKVVEAVKEGAAFDDVKVLCGRLFKQLGRFSDRQITKLSENQVVDDNDKYRKQKQGDRMLRTAAKIAQKAEDLNLVSDA